METFCGVDKPLYEIDDFNDLWSVESFDSPMDDIDIVGDADSQDWDCLLSGGSGSVGGHRNSPAVVLNDRMMTDAAPSVSIIAPSLPYCFDNRPSDHSYSMANEIGSDCSTTGSDIPENSHHNNSISLFQSHNNTRTQGLAAERPHDDRITIEYEDHNDKDLDVDCMLAVPMNSINQNNNMLVENFQIKSEPPSPPSSPGSATSSVGSDIESFDSSESLLSSNYSSSHQTLLSTTSLHHPQSLLKQPTIVLATRQNSQNNNQSQRSRMMFPKVNIKVEPQSTGFVLPPTPPSSSNGSDSESSTSPSPSSTKTHHSQSQRVISASGAIKNLNHSQLISSQPKGATGVLLLTDEEKRTLIAEGYPIPQRLPLTKAEEKSLKKIRRKIKNKISAQESRRKKKEYMDTLEKKVEILQNENSDYKRRLDSLESTNHELLSQLRELQVLVGGTSRISSHNSTSVMPKKLMSISKHGIKL